jgi:hypothetical protein
MLTKDEFTRIDKILAQAQEFVSDMADRLHKYRLDTVISKAQMRQIDRIEADYILKERGHGEEERGWNRS